MSSSLVSAACTRSLAETIGQRGSLDQFQNQRAAAVTFFQTVNGRDIGMVQRPEDVRLTTEPRESFGIAREEIGQRRGWTLTERPAGRKRRRSVHA